MDGLGVACVKTLRMIVANSTQDFRFQLSLCLADPLAACNTNSLIALCAPSVWSRILRVVGSSEKADAPLQVRALDDMLTDERLGLWAVLYAIDG